MAKRKSGAFPALGMVSWMLAVPYNFLFGYVTGVVAPLAAIAAMVAGIRLFTGKVPFPTHVQEEDEGGDRQLSIGLVSPEEAAELFAEQKEQIGREFGNMKAEIQAVMEEGKTEAQPAAEGAGSKSSEG